ncbi:hypothetical protein M514_14982 [Trichuris suis]|uniref:Uncharacterized protein n=1 Tax=Trichuris suis TaxID=68888 RepID=A0A085NUD2_9BILA|nr:hypothetical protein M514_14982 [Trichuris suis]
MNHALIHRLDEEGGVGRQQLYLDTLRMHIGMVLASIVQKQQHLELHTQAEKIFLCLGLRDKALLEPL